MNGEEHGGCEEHERSNARGWAYGNSSFCFGGGEIDGLKRKRHGGLGDAALTGPSASDLWTGHGLSRGARAEKRREIESRTWAWWQSWKHDGAWAQRRSRRGQCTGAEGSSCFD